MRKQDIKEVHLEYEGNIFKIGKLVHPRIGRILCWKSSNMECTEDCAAFHRDNEDVETRIFCRALPEHAPIAVVVTEQVLDDMPEASKVR